MKVKRICKILGINLRHHALLPFAMAVGIFLLTASVFNLSALTAKEAAKPLEFFLCFTGVMLFTPICYPEQDHEVRDVICSRKLSYAWLCLLRLLYSFVFLVLLETAFVVLLKNGESTVTTEHLFSGIATAVFLGSIGFFVAGVTDNVTLGYMAAMLYYLLSYGAKEKLGKFYLFYMCAGRFEEKKWLFLGAAALIFLKFIVYFCRFLRYDRCMGKFLPDLKNSFKKRR